MLSIRCSQIELVLQQPSSHVSTALLRHAQYTMATVTKPHPQHHKLAHSHTKHGCTRRNTREPECRSPLTCMSVRAGLSSTKSADDKWCVKREEELTAQPTAQPTSNPHSAQTLFTAVNDPSLVTMTVIFTT